jgi:hypothetical protein
MGRCRGGHRIAMDVRKVNPGLFEHVAVAQHPAAPAATAFPLPGVFNKRCAIDSAQLLAKVVLELEQKSFNLRGIGFH